MGAKRIAIIAKRDEGRQRFIYEAVEACGAVPVTLVPGDDTAILSEVDGLLLPGGGDISPSRYGEENTRSECIDDALDEFELSAMERAVELWLPVLGICRGHQLINVYFGGSLIQHVGCCARHCRENERDKVHGVITDADSYLYDIYGRAEYPVNSAHHQAIDRLGNGLVAVQHSDDGLIEGIIHSSLPIWGVQWHPERMCLDCARGDTVDGLRIFEFFEENL